ncbi:MAG: phosphoribosyltransferase family protein [Chloroflexi bacterium]|nr:phosphoribosyltransferase family protein [Chloroflexota bacterium]
MDDQNTQDGITGSGGSRAARDAEQDIGNLWLARVLWEMGAVQFGDFTVGRSTVHSPVYVNVRLLVSDPTALLRASRVLEDETKFELMRRRPRVSPFDLIAGVPFGGLHLATAFSLSTKIPMIYAYNRNEGGRSIEGRYQPGQTVLIIDDLITTGGSVLQTARLLEDAGLVVKDAVVLIDREAGAAETLRHHGYNLMPILSLEVMLNYYLSTGRITEDVHRRCMDYLADQSAPGSNATVI